MLKTLLDRPISVTMVMFVAVVLGIVSSRFLPISLIPDVDIPHITVQARSSTMSAREMDEAVVGTLKQRLMQVNALENITAQSRDGICNIRLTFSQSANMDYAFVEVNEMIDRCMSSLPDMERPRVLKASATDIPAFYLNLTSTIEGETAFDEMSRFARDVIIKRIEQQEEVAMVDISGFTDEQIMIIPDKNKLQQLGISFQQFGSIIVSANIHLGTLTICDGQYRYSVRFLSEVSSPEDIADIWFRSGDKLMQLKEIASVEQQSVRKGGLVRSDSQRAVCMAIIKQSDASMADLRRVIDDIVEKFSSDYPTIKFTVTRDQTQLLEYSINSLAKNIIAGILLACLIIFLFMRDFRTPALVCLTMPVALIFSIAVFYVCGISINIISLSGLLLGVGMMADNTIILVDNITARWQRGDSLREAVLLGTREVSGPMLSSVLTTCAVFIPLIFISGIAGKLFYDQAMAVTIVLLSSYLVTITVIPVYYWWWYHGSSSFRPNPVLEKISFDKKMLGGEKRLLNWFLEHRWLTVCTLAMSLCGVVICFTMMPKERLPKMTCSELIMNIDWNDQINIEENERRVADLENMISNDCIQLTSMVGAQHFVLDHSGDMGAGECSIYFNCSDEHELERVKDKLLSVIKTDYPSATTAFAVPGNIFDAVFADNDAVLTARIRPVSTPAIELNSLRELQARLGIALPKARINDIPVKTDVLYVADPKLMALYGVSYDELSSFLRNALKENKLFSIVQGSRTIPVLSGIDYDNLLAGLSDKYIIKDGVNIPLEKLLRQTYVEDFKTVVTGAEGNYYPIDISVSQNKVQSVMRTIDEVMRSDGRYEVSFSGSWFSSRKIILELLLVLCVSVILLYLILASQFESLVQPLLILSEIVIDVFASVLVLWILGLSINLMSMIGLVVISGIVINDSILKTDTINKLRKEGVSLRHAIVQASGMRMKSIIMTSLTTILAVCPFLSRGSMGADLQYPMSLVIIIGMTIGTFVSMFLLPTLYYMVYKKDE